MSLSPPMRITSARNPRILAVVALSEQRERRATGLFVAEGRRAVTRALQAGLILRELYLCPALDSPGAAALIPPPGAAVFDVPESLLQKMAYQQHPEGVLGVFEQAGRTLADLGSVLTSRDFRGREGVLPNSRSDLDKGATGRPSSGDPCSCDLSQGSAQTPARGTRIGQHAPGSRGSSELWLVAVGLAKPGNLGAVARTAAVAGATGLLVADAVVDVYNPNAIRASTGAVFTLPVAAASSAEIRRFLADRGVTIVAAAPAAKEVYTRADLTGPVALVIGAEDTGLDDAWLAAGQTVRIPMHAGEVDSLNAGVAAAVLLFEALRQRGG
jgi:TrmH family RNA methyltransferase